MVAVDGHGTTLGYATAVDGSYTDIGQITSIDGGGLSRGTADVTNIASTAREFILNGFYEAGELAVDLRYDPREDTHEFLTTQMTTAAPDVYFYKITFNVALGTATYACAGWITDVSPAIETEDALTASVTIQLTGAATLTTTDP